MYKINMFLFILPIFFIRYVLVFILRRERLTVLDYFPEAVGAEKFGKISYLLINTFLLLYPLLLKTGDISFTVISGFILYLTGLLCYLKSILDFVKWKGLINHGVYKISRNPQAVSFIIMYLAISVMGNSFIYLLLCLFLIYSFYLLARSEERYCLQVYGDVYRKYMKETPRFLLK